MKFLSKFFPPKIVVENTGQNHGVEAGNNSGLIINNNGLTYSDTKALCYDIVSEELDKYKNEAHDEAEKRYNELFGLLIEKLDKNNMSDGAALSEFKKPAMQYDYFEAQKSYIKAGTPEMAEVLSNVLLERISESERTLLQIALGEAIHTVPKLIKSQMATLAMFFVLHHTKSLRINSHESFSAFLRNVILKLYYHGVSKKFSEFQHLSSCGCGQISGFTVSFISDIRNIYGGIFMKGYLKDEMVASEDGQPLYEKYPKLFTSCLNDKEKIQINAMSKESLEEFFVSYNVNVNDQKIITKIYENNLMNVEEIKTLIIKLVPEMQEVIDYWADGYISYLNLSSVGIIIGAQYSKLITQEDYDLHIWI